MRELSTIDKASILIKAATGEPYGDGDMVTDLCVGYAEPGYGSDDAVVVFGNWNPKRFPRGDDEPLRKSESLPVRLGNALTAIGVECEWLDEWAVCEDCRRAMRTQPDSYGWTMYGAFVEDACGYVCADCMVQDPESYLTDYLNEPTRAITWCEPKDLADIGFDKWEPGNPQDYENGFHPGQTDDPKEILSEILEIHPDAEVAFFIDGVGQFDVRFSAWVRLAEDDE